LTLRRVQVEDTVSKLFPLPTEYTKERVQRVSLSDYAQEYRDSIPDSRTPLEIPNIQYHLNKSLQHHMQLVSSGLYFLPPTLRDPESLKDCNLHELIELKVSLGNMIQGYGMWFYDMFSELLQEKLEQVDKEVEKKRTM